VAGKPSWAGSSEEFLQEQSKRHIELIERDLKKAIDLLKNTDCIHCDGSGAIPHQFMDGDWDFQQCQWCDESKWLIENYKDWE